MKNYIYKIIWEHKYSLLLIYLYIFTAQLLFLAEPYILGKTIDGLLVGNYFWIFVFLGVELVGNVFWYKRMVMDTKVYTKMYNQLIFEYLDQDKDSEVSAKLARTDLAHSIIHFLEWDMHYYIMSLISIVGALCFIFIEHTLTGCVVVIATSPVVWVVVKFYKKIAQGTRVSNTHFEQKMSVMETEDIHQIKTFFKRRARVIIAQSTIQGKNWAALNSVKTIFLILALVVYTNGNLNLSQGQAIAIYAYIHQFLISLMSIPIGMETFTRIKDVLSRINAVKK
jgi:hypothetical protein